MARRGLASSWRGSVGARWAAVARPGRARAAPPSPRPGFRRQPSGWRGGRAGIRGRLFAGGC
eukprot:11212021-Lingulodinium_polyedra.AAC.1